jgi:hypothetical protein
MEQLVQAEGLANEEQLIQAESQANEEQLQADTEEPVNHNIGKHSNCNSHVTGCINVA